MSTPDNAASSRDDSTEGAHEADHADSKPKGHHHGGGGVFDQAREHPTGESGQGVYEQGHHELDEEGVYEQGHKDQGEGAFDQGRPDEDDPRTSS